MGIWLVCLVSGPRPPCTRVGRLVVQWLRELISGRDAKVNIKQGRGWESEIWRFIAEWCDLSGSSGSAGTDTSQWRTRPLRQNDDSCWSGVSVKVKTLGVHHHYLMTPGDQNLSIFCQHSGCSLTMRADLRKRWQSKHQTEMWTRIVNTKIFRQVVWLERYPEKQLLV